MLESAERYDEALAAAQRSLLLIPRFRPGVQSEAHILQLLGREREALDHLSAASDCIESGIVVAHLAALQIDLRMFEDARRSYERYAELSPLRDKETEKWIAARRADSAYFCGDLSTAREQSLQAKDPFYTSFAENLVQSVLTPATVRLEIPKSNGPGRAASVLDLFPIYWHIAAKSAPSDLSPQDGLQDVRERLWAEENGLVTIEFTATPPAVFNVLDRGVPLLLTLVDAGYSHAQMVVGCDRLRNSIWIVDGSNGRPHEAPLSLLTERYASSGPRAVALAPHGELARLNGIEFPDRDAYDRLYEVQLAIHRHERRAAADAYDRMKSVDGSHRLTRLARLAIARYDANPTLMLHAIDSLLSLFPDDNTHQLTRLNVLRDLGRRDERTEAARRQTLRKGADPLFAHHYAQAIMIDPSRLVETERLMCSAVRQRPYAPAGYYILGNILWEQQRFQEATDSYRFAAALEVRDEQFAEAYFRAARAIEQGPEAMRFPPGSLRADARQGGGTGSGDFLRQERKRRHGVGVRGTRSVLAPAGRRPQSARSGRGHALRRRNAHQLQRSGRRKKALGRGSTTCRTSCMVAVRVSSSACSRRLAEARRCWEELLRDEPLAADIHRNCRRAVADLEGRAAAVAWVRQLSDAFRITIRSISS